MLFLVCGLCGRLLSDLLFVGLLFDYVYLGGLFNFECFAFCFE